MKNKELRNLIITILISAIGIMMFIIGSIYDEMPLAIGGLGFALAGISIELYIKSKRDITTEKGEKRSEIEKNDERNVFVNAKSGETINFIMDNVTLIAFIAAIQLNVSLEGQFLIFFLIIIRAVLRPIIKRYYENKL